MPFFEKGKAFYYKRLGQLDMACAHCHEKYYGKKFRMNTLSQGMSNGFPTYRLLWQKPGSLHRMFTGCNYMVRAKLFKKGSDEYMNLELYLAWRGMGLPVETPAVRF
jgi:sulfur-oxidizing protein SoxA